MEKMLHYVKKAVICAALICMAAAACGPDAFASDAAEQGTFIRVDRDDPEAYDRELENLRFISGSRYQFQDVNEKYGIAPDRVPNETGLDTLDVSASAQFNVWQFRDLAHQLREASDGRKICIIDLRRESHALLNGRPFSIYAPRNCSNLGLSADEIMADEEQRFSSMVGSTIEAHPKDGDAPGETCVYEIESFLSEKELVESEGMTYVRIPVQDHCWPEPESVDQFIDLVKNVGIDNLWLHIHCHAGKGRTGAFLVMYDKMKNPDVSIEDIAVRQALLGSSYMLYTDSTNPVKGPLYEEKARMTLLFGEYVEENHDTGYEVSWSQWLEEFDCDKAA